MTTSVSAFLYRLPRFEILFPLEFVPDDPSATPITGRCLNLSNTGLLGSFTYPIGGGTYGLLRLKPAMRVFPVRVFTTHTEGMHSGMQFAFANDQERQLIRALVDAIASRSAQPL